MRLLLDTHILLWAASSPNKLSEEAKSLINAPDNELLFSVMSIWEVVIKSSLGRKDFQLDANLLWRGLVDNGYQELGVNSKHALAIRSMPPIHKDPFDRILVAQACVEGVNLLTSDKQVAKYSGPIQLV